MKNKPMKQAAVKVRRKFDDTFKREAVQNWLSSGKSAEVIAGELGLKANRKRHAECRLTEVCRGYA